MVNIFPTEAPAYKHPYGGVARDSYVSRDGFARFFEHSVEYVDTLPVNQKLFDDMQPGCEMLGYKIQETRDGRGPYLAYRITIIDYKKSRN